MAAPEGGEPLPWPTYRILSATARLEELRINRRLAHLHLTQGALEALESVADLEPARISDLAALMCVSQQSLGKVLRRLESLGLLKRERGRDARTTNITLTPHGRTVLITAEKLLGTMEKPVSDEDAALRRSLQQHLNELRNN
jgi:DNA-binding MarR family transcriptional regulator